MRKFAMLMALFVAGCSKNPQPTTLSPASQEAAPVATAPAAPPQPTASPEVGIAGKYVEYECNLPAYGNLLHVRRVEFSGTDDDPRMKVGETLDGLGLMATNKTLTGVYAADGKEGKEGMYMFTENVAGDKVPSLVYVQRRSSPYGDGKPEFLKGYVAGDVGGILPEILYRDTGVPLSMEYSPCPVLYTGATQ